MTAPLHSDKARGKGVTTDSDTEQSEKRDGMMPNKQRNVMPNKQRNVMANKQRNEQPNEQRNVTANKQKRDAKQTEERDAEQADKSSGPSQPRGVLTGENHLRCNKCGTVSVYRLDPGEGYS